MIKSILITIGVFLGIDAIWLGVISRGFYDKYLAPFERHFYLPAAILVYLVLPIGLYFLVLTRNISTPLQALGWGALYGLVAYGTYDLSNWAVLADWSPVVVVVDILWGMTISGVTAMIVFYLTR